MFGIWFVRTVSTTYTIHLRHIGKKRPNICLFPLKNKQHFIIQLPRFLAKIFACRVSGLLPCSLWGLLTCSGGTGRRVSWRPCRGTNTEQVFGTRGCWVQTSQCHDLQAVARSHVTRYTRSRLTTQPGSPVERSSRKRPRCRAKTDRR